MHAARGMTLIELVLVIAIIGLVALSVQPLASLSREGLDAAARKVLIDLQYTQGRAMMTGANHGILFTAGQGYQVYQGTTATLITDPFTRAVFDEDLSDYRNAAVSFTYQVEFDPTGTPVLGGGGSVTLSNGTSSKVIAVTANTGYVEIQ